MQYLEPYLLEIACGGVLLGMVAFVGFLVLRHRFQHFSRPYEELVRASEAEGASTALQAHLLGVERNQKRNEETLAYAHQLETQLQCALQGVGFLKYDAFEDIRGQQSYSLCLLDAHENGVILTSISGRNNYRGYAKPVRNGTCELMLSDEEKQALAHAKEHLGHTEAPLAKAV